MEESVFTIGHSTHSLDAFVALLHLHGITAVFDVRSQPYSRFNPQFDREALAKSLRDCGISYVFLGNELGARSEDPACYEAGRVQYGRLADTVGFRHGLERVRNGMEDFRLALMCAEKEPLECHRGILVARHLEAQGVEVQHIHADGKLESHKHAMQRLLHILKWPDRDMFRTHEEVLADAYYAQEKRIAYDAVEGFVEDARGSGNEA
jgi:uncharacterized protein (DUF488 family)